MDGGTENQFHLACFASPAPTILGKLDTWKVMDDPEETSFLCVNSQQESGGLAPASQEG